MLSKRLEAVAKMVKHRSVADIGTDHAYIPIYLYKLDAIDKAIACDVKKGPIEKAQSNIKKYGFEDAIQTRLGSGLSVVSPHEAECAVISGMGGMLIIDILENDRLTAQSFKQLVLQPQLDVEAVRMYVHSLGYIISDEDMVFDNGKYYNIISAERGIENYNDDPLYYKFGKILIYKKSPVLKNYCEYMIEKLENIIKNNASKSKRSSDVFSQYQKECKAYREVIKLL